MMGIKNDHHVGRRTWDVGRGTWPARHRIELAGGDGGRSTSYIQATPTSDSRQTVGGGADVQRPTSLKLLLLLTVFALLVPCRSVFANNLTISNFTVTNVNTTANTMTFSFDVTQDHSWRSSTNYDAIWMFIKFSTDGGATWKHATLAGSGINPSGFSAPSGFEIIVPTDETGFFLQRSGQGSGSINATGVKVVWDYGQNGVSDTQAAAANTMNKIFGIEMVYVPTGAFYAGDGNSNSEYRFKQGSADNDPWYISSEGAITTTNSASDGFYYTSSGSPNEEATGASFLIPTSFPKGYAPFYLMKYELTEGEWVNFFNTLTPAQKINRDITSSTQGGKNADSVVNRNTIAWDATTPTSAATTILSSRPVSYISCADVLAFADWSGLRPITELEFEKAARGKDITPVANEFVWGTASYDAAGVNEISPNTDENGSEIISDPNSNLNRTTLGWSSGDGRSGGSAQGQTGPLRTGIFAEGGDNRVTSGAGYYGNMELSGNLQEPVVTVGRSQGRQFLGTHGDGLLTNLSGYEGNATNLDWPGINSTDSGRGVTGTIGCGYRGGDFASSSLLPLQLSSRSYAAKEPDSEGSASRYDSSSGQFYGGRLGRSAP